MPAVRNWPISNSSIAQSRASCHALSGTGFLKKLLLGNKMLKYLIKNKICPIVKAVVIWTLKFIWALIKAIIFSIIFWLCYLLIKQNLF